MSSIRRALDMLRRPFLRSPSDDMLRRLGSAVLDAARVNASAPPESLEFVEVGSLREYREHLSRTSAMRRSRIALERLLAVPQKPFTCLGYDACVERFAEFRVDFEFADARDEEGLLLPNYRECLVSSATKLNCRQRATVLALRHLLAGRDPRKVSIYATEAVTPLFAWLRRAYPSTIGSEYYGNAVPLGQERNGVRNEDVTALTFADASFDAVVTCDVLEHVPAYANAFRELRRVLRPGGLLLATVPFRLDRHDHLIRARLTPSGDVEHLESPELHGDPLSVGGILCYQHFGWELLDDLRTAGFKSAAALLVWSYFHGILGGEQALFYAIA